MLDILFTGTQDSAVDKEFATTCNNFDNIVIGMNLLFNTEGSCSLSPIQPKEQPNIKQMQINKQNKLE